MFLLLLNTSTPIPYSTRLLFLLPLLHFYLSLHISVPLLFDICIESLTIPLALTHKMPSYQRVTLRPNALLYRKILVLLFSFFYVSQQLIFIWLSCLSICFLFLLLLIFFAEFPSFRLPTLIRLNNRIRHCLFCLEVMSFPILFFFGPPHTHTHTHTHTHPTTHLSKSLISRL